MTTTERFARAMSSDPQFAELMKYWNAFDDAGKQWLYELVLSTAAPHLDMPTLREKFLDHLLKGDEAGAEILKAEYRRRSAANGKIISQTLSRILGS